MTLSIRLIGTTAFILAVLSFAVAKDTSKGSESPAKPLVLLKTTSIDGIDGDFDHFAVDLDGNRLYLAAEENKTVEIFDLKGATRIGTIRGFDTPHGLVYLPDTKRLLVVDGGEGGSCKIVDTRNNQIEKSIALSPDADAVAYDRDQHLLYVGNGGKEAKHDYSLISIIDTTKEEKIGDIRLPSANLEAMVLESTGSHLYVNMRDKNQIGVVDRKTRSFVTGWTLNGVNFNTPLQLDETHHRLFVAGRNPGKFGVVDSESGKEIASLAIPNGADDMAFDPSSGRIYVSCGEGYVAVIQQKSPDEYTLIAKVPSGTKGKVGVLVAALQRYYIVTTSKPGTPAKLLVYEVSK